MYYKDWIFLADRKTKFSDAYGPYKGFRDIKKELGYWYVLIFYRTKWKKDGGKKKLSFKLLIKLLCKCIPNSYFNILNSMSFNARD